MKKLFFVLAIAAISTSANAQNEKTDATAKPLTFSVGVEAGLPIGDWSKGTYGAGFAIGGSVQGQYNVAQGVGITLNAGYINVSAKNNGGSLGLIPVLAGVKYTFTGGPYIHGQAGLTVATANSTSTSGFGYAGGVGYSFTKSVDAELKYQGMSKNSVSSSFVGLRLAYNF